MLLSNPFRPDPRVLKEARSLVETSHQLTIVAWDRRSEFPSQEQFAPGIEIWRIQNIFSSYGIGLRQILPLIHFWQAAEKVMSQLKPDLVHCHDFDTLPVGLWWAKRHHRPVIYDAHEYYADMVRPRLNFTAGRFVYMAIRKMERFFARHTDAIITVDESLADIYRPLNAKVLIIGHYPSSDFMTQSAPVFSHPQLNLLYLGRLSLDRGLLIYLDIMRYLHAAGIPAILHLAGAFTPASEENDFLTEAIDLREFLQLSGWLSYGQVPQALLQADVGLSLLQPEPRYVASLPVKLFEYMAAGLPVIASDFPAIRQVVARENCGALLTPSDPQSAAKLLADWWRQPELPRRLGYNGRQAVLTRYNWESLAEKIDCLYQTLV